MYGEFGRSTRPGMMKKVPSIPWSSSIWTAGIWSALPSSKLSVTVVLSGAAVPIVIVCDLVTSALPALSQARNLIVVVELTGIGPL